MNKTLSFSDKIYAREKYRIQHPAALKTKIKAWVTDTGEVIFKERENMVTIAGGAFLARALFDLPNSVEMTPSYNAELNLDHTTVTTTITAPNKAYLFCVGYDGCGRENSQVYAERYASWISPTDGIIPFQYVPVDEDLNSNEKTLYFGKKTMDDNIAYYFKKFDSDPMLVQQLTDGTPIDSSIYNMDTSLDAETIVTMQLSITKSDCRDYFINTTGINDCRVNALSICTAWKEEIDGQTYYQDIRPCTLLHFPNESLIDTEKSITFSYSIYF